MSTKAQQLSPIESDKEQFLRNVADAVPALVVVYNVKTGEYVYVNKALKKLLGYTPKKFVEGGFAFVTSIVHPEDLPRILEENTAALQMANSKDARPDNEPIVNFEYRMKHKKGNWVWLHTDGSVYSRDKDGKVEYVLNVSLDITRRKEAEDMLKKNASEKREYEKTLIDHIVDAVIVTDTQYNVTGWNKGAEEVYGWKAEEMMGKFTPHFLQTQFVDDAENWVESLKKKGYWKGEVVQKRKDGTRVPILASVAYIKNDKGEVVGAFAVNRDITRRKEQEKRKDDFIALVSHELKTPVTSLKIFAQVLEKRYKKLGDIESVSYFAKMDRQLTKLSELVTRLLDVPRSQEGKLQFKKEAFSLDELISDTIENVQRITSSHRVIFVKKKGGSVVADKDRIEQVLINLINNAVKYSPGADKVVIEASTNKKHAIVHVKDHGMGIPKEYQQEIFARFYQVDRGTENTYPGLGVGLYISKEIIERHAGKIWVESEEGKGSSFFFSIPIKENSR